MFSKWVLIPVSIPTWHNWIIQHWLDYNVLPKHFGRVSFIIMMAKSEVRSLWILFSTKIFLTKNWIFSTYYSRYTGYAAVTPLCPFCQNTVLRTPGNITLRLSYKRTIGSNQFYNHGEGPYLRFHIGSPVPYDNCVGVQISCLLTAGQHLFSIVS